MLKFIKKYVLIVYLAISYACRYILNSKTGKKKYTQLLKCQEWQDKRLEILKRDNFKCTWCGSEDKQLCVHHKYYIRYTNFYKPKPWEYPNDALVTLCNSCHRKYHLTHKLTIKILDYGQQEKSSKSDTSFEEVS